MGQKEVYDFLKKNRNSFFSSEELAKILGVNKQTMYSLLRKLDNKDDVVYKEIIIEGGPVKKLYCFKMKDEYLEEIKHARSYLNENDPICKDWMIEAQLLVVLIRELKIINKRLEHLENLGEGDKK
jgi:hypothetical protein